MKTFEELCEAWDNNNWNYSLDMYELFAINMPIDSKYGRQRFAQYDKICIDDKGDINLKAEYASHLIIGVYSTIASTDCVLILVDVITNEPLIFEL